MTLVGADTGEVLNGSSLEIATEPSSLVAVDQQCSQVEAWAAQCGSVAALRDASNKLAAIDEYLSRTSTEGRGRVAAAMRRLEVRIGKLLGPAEHGGDRRSNQVPRGELDPTLSPKQRSDFRKMAENEDVVEDVIADSDDDKPASRNKVKAAINDKPKTDGQMSEARWQRIKYRASQGASSRQLADEHGIRIDVFKVQAKRRGIQFPADEVVGRTRRIDSNRVVEETVLGLAGEVQGLDLIVFSDLDPDRIEGWIDSLSDSLRHINRLRKQLREVTS